MKFEMFSEIVCKNGKTIKENNMEISHNIPKGQLVEIIPWDEESKVLYEGVRCRVLANSRDCDGTPLYSVGAGSLIISHGLSEENLRVII